MKEFVKMMLAVICAFIVMQIVGFFLFFVMIGSVAALGSGKTVLPREGVLDLDMSQFSLGEQTLDESFSPTVSLLGLTAGGPTVGLWDAVQAIEAAAADPGIKYVLLRADAASGGVSTMEELRAALAEFRKSGKAVVAYTENPSTGSYYLASVADKVYMTSYHGGNAQMIGLSSRMLFLKDLLDKVGVNYQLIRHGKYKSAGEMYIKNAPSDENREQYQVMVNSLWKTLSAATAESRGLTEEKLNELVDNLRLNFPEDFLENGLVDELLDHEGLVNKLCALAQVEKQEDLHLIPFADYVSAKVLSFRGKDNVAILFADGEIIDGNDKMEIASDRFVAEIDKIRKDNTVKAVVLRVNSPGGSVVASEKIRTALKLLMAEKPLVASYGNYAASGGYWISAGTQKIFSDATCLTGSIGVFSLIPEFSKTAGKLGVNIVTVGSNKHSGMYSLMRPFDKEEEASMQAYVEDIYGRFVNIVAEGRSLEAARVDDLGQGRVWVGTDALERGLVDEIGGLREAVDYAASLAGFVNKSDYRVVGFPAPLSWSDQLLEMISGRKDEPSILAGTPFEEFGKALKDLRENEPSKVYARLP
ncbi:MAG: signal peptide peptidase SppA, partial [Bacteroidales bacterium]|nr:signal peptide peptidase SppA [Bacteroidales bacterium]